MTGTVPIRAPTQTPVVSPIYRAGALVWVRINAGAGPVCLVLVDGHRRNLKDGTPGGWGTLLDGPEAGRRKWWFDSRVVSVGHLLGGTRP